MLDAVGGYYKRRFGVEGITRDKIMSVSGSQDGIGHLGLALLNDGDTVLLPDPCYPVFMTGMRLGGGVPWFYTLTRENRFLPDVHAISAEIARKAKVMLVSLPANPVGSIGTPELYREIVDFCQKYDILLVHDNAYSDIIFDGAKGGSIFNTPGAEEVAVEFFSLSKSFNVTGARISFLVGRPDVVAACKKLRTQIDFGMFLPVQQAAIAALTGPLDSVRAQCAVYQARRDALCGGLRAIGWDLPDSHGSMFVWAPLPHGRQDSMAFCLELYREGRRDLHAGRKLRAFGRGVCPLCADPARRGDPPRRRRHPGQRHPLTVFVSHPFFLPPKKPVFPHAGCVRENGLLFAQRKVSGCRRLIPPPKFPRCRAGGRGCGAGGCRRLPGHRLPQGMPA